jgi:hypothetical protein
MKQFEPDFDGLRKLVDKVVETAYDKVSEVMVRVEETLDNAINDAEQAYKEKQGGAAASADWPSVADMCEDLARRNEDALSLSGYQSAWRKIDTNSVRASEVYYWWSRLPASYKTAKSGGSQDKSTTPNSTRLIDALFNQIPDLNKDKPVSWTDVVDRVTQEMKSRADRLPKNKS